MGYLSVGMSIYFILSILKKKLDEWMETVFPIV